uniref:NADH-ubiquinone oxidoreductase chain 4L n=1 Tax=Saphonecrus sp. ZJUH 20220015 TaxID=2943460 RepID=A0A9E8K0X0_9HYME|nr:NADH dehydrogenase subunit 4L [Saphonecrus sp. ZJUH 20220015]
MFNLLIYIIYMYMICCLLFTLYYSHLLMTLMCMEFMMLSMMVYMYMFMLLMNFDYLLLIYLLIIVCEGVLGLSLLIIFIRFKGFDKLNLINLNMW